MAKRATIKRKAPAAKPDDAEVDEIIRINANTVTFRIIGTAPLVMNRMAEKARQELLYPTQKTRADRLASLKHNPIEEFRSSVYRNRDNGTPTALHMPSGAFHDALASAALDIPGTAKAKVARWTVIETPTVFIWGAPQLMMSVVRQSDMRRTPDIRTRAVLPEWCAEISITHLVDLLSVGHIERLLHAAGMMVGVGDGRPEKGKLNFGRWRVARDDNKDMALYEQMVVEGGRVAQQQALADPICYDIDSEDLFRWFGNEYNRRTKLLGTRKREAAEKISGDTNGNDTGRRRRAAATAGDAWA